MMVDTSRAFTINGRTFADDPSRPSSSYTYEQLVSLAGGQVGDTVTVHYPDDRKGRAPRPGEAVPFVVGMIVDVADTSGA